MGVEAEKGKFVMTGFDKELKRTKEEKNPPKVQQHAAD